MTDRRPLGTSSTSWPANVVPFPGQESGPGSGESRQMWEEILSGNQELKEAMEGVIMSAWYQATQRLPATGDDPFDPIFIAELTPDQLCSADIELLDKCSSIKDLSAEISFADGWDEDG